MARGTYHRINKQITTDEVRGLDIRKIDKKMFNYVGWTNYYTWDDGEYIEYRIEPDRLIVTSSDQILFLDKTRCNYGGHRYWFKCPQCNERSGVLYNKNSKFLCRQCHKLPYSSQRESDVYRLVRKIRKIRRRLNVSYNLSEPILTKPKGMHWKTFEYLRKKEMILSQKYAQAAIAYLGINLEYFFGQT